LNQAHRRHIRHMSATQTPRQIIAQPQACYRFPAKMIYYPSYK